jgi:esterase
VSAGALARMLVTAKGASPSSWAVFLHGILGRGGNWATLARRLVHERPAWGAALVDLRMHGGSLGLPPPHTIEASARDLESLSLPGPVRAVVGHSFGGKVALAWFLKHADELDDVVVIDANPAARRPAGGGTDSAAGSDQLVEAVTKLLRSLPAVLPTRQEFVARFLAGGCTPEVAQWLAMNVARVEHGDGFTLQLDLDAIEALLSDYFALDLWSAIEDPPGFARVHVVVGERSPSFSDESRARLQRAAERLPDRVHVHVLPAGHWVHVDDPEGTLEVLRGALP